MEKRNLSVNQRLFVAELEAQGLEVGYHNGSNPSPFVIVRDVAEVRTCATFEVEPIGDMLQVYAGE